MFKFIKTAALSAFIGLGAFAAMPATAQAQSGGIYLGFGDQGPRAGFHFNDRGRHDYRDRGRHGFRDHRGCSARQAVRKAERMGFRHARVVGQNHRVIRVAGRKFGPRSNQIVFANARNCPVLR